MKWTRGSVAFLTAIFIAAFISNEGPVVTAAYLSIVVFGYVIYRVLAHWLVQ